MCTDAHFFICVYAHVHVCMCRWRCMCTDAHFCTCVGTYERVCMYRRKCKCACRSVCVLQMYIFAYVCMHTYMCACADRSVCVQTDLHFCICAYAHMCICVCTYVHMHMEVCAQMHIFAHAWVHMYMCACADGRRPQQISGIFLHYSSTLLFEARSLVNLSSWVRLVSLARWLWGFWALPPEVIISSGPLYFPGASAASGSTNSSLHASSASTLTTKSSLQPLNHC